MDRFLRTIDKFKDFEEGDMEDVNFLHASMVKRPVTLFHPATMMSVLLRRGL
jgi:hypothetical protein